MPATVEPSLFGAQHTFRQANGLEHPVQHAADFLDFSWRPNRPLPNRLFKGTSTRYAVCRPLTPALGFSQTCTFSILRLRIMQMRYVAVSLWLLSWFLPSALHQDKSLLLGYELVFQGALRLLLTAPISLFAFPLFWFSMATHLLVANEAMNCLQRVETDWSPRMAALLVAAFFVNLFVAMQLNRLTGGANGIFSGLFNFPGVYCWLGAYGLLAVSAIIEYQHFVRGMFIRLASVGAVAIVVALVLFAIGLAM